MPILTYRDALTEALREEMERDPDVFLMGEEVAEYDGAYKVSRGLLDTFGDKRVVDTPITELGFAGLGVGAAMAGLRPIIEFMTFNFALLAIDQIVNNAAKISYMSGGQFRVPIVFRGPSGGALQLAGQHSQTFDSWYANVPGLKVVAPATPADAKGLLKTSIRDNNPVIFLEGEMLYNTKGEVPDGEHLVPLGKADVKREGSDVTIVCYAKSVAPALKAADTLQREAGISCEVIDIRTIRPLDTDTLIDSVRKTNRGVIVEEGWPYSGIGAQLVDTIQREAFDELDAPLLRVTGADVPMPYNKKLERAAKPNPQKVIDAVKQVTYTA
ncbi:MAG: pyruvate dehydrogenase complex E1 component subunit beta [Gemmatimonadetes bacterium]|nr:pyruvate dehydrogenase complex E1 component subunit beta [Gemmatimonadota bacterium]